MTIKRAREILKLSEDKYSDREVEQIIYETKRLISLTQKQGERTRPRIRKYGYIDLEIYRDS